MRQYRETLLYAAFTAVFVGYFLVWLPGPGAGLQLMGLEVGEWVKFMGMDTRRNWFYLPPITLGLMMALLTALWPNDRWQTWGMRATAVAVSILAFPAIEDIMGAYRQEYMARIVGIGLVMAVSLISGILAWRSANERWLPSFIWSGLVLFSLVGLILPTWAYLLVRPAVSEWLGVSVGVGIGVWLNGLGHLGATAVALWLLWDVKGKR